jgi:hypothetical protein
MVVYAATGALAVCPASAAVRATASSTTPSAPPRLSEKLFGSPRWLQPRVALVNVRRTVADVNTSITVGGATVTVTLASGEKGYVSFAGTAGEHLGLGLANVSFPCCPTVTVLDPNGSQILFAGFNGGGAQNLPTLTTSGTFTMVIDPGTGTGSVDLTLSDDANSGAVSIGGSTVTASISRIGQNGRLTFSGTSGENLGLGLTNVSFPCCPSVTVLDPSGSQILFAGFNGGGGQNLPTLTMSGTYTVIIDPGTGTGSVDLTLSDDISGGTLAAGGSSVTATIGRAGQNERLTFSGTSGENVGLGLTNVSFPCCPSVTVLDPNGSQVLFAGFNGGGDQNLPTLTVSGTYTLIIDPGTGTGSVDLTLSDDINGGTLAVGGSTLTATIGRVGQNERFTFSGTSGENLGLGLTNGTLPCCSTVTVLGPNSSQILYAGFGSSSDQNLPTLTTTGTYTLIVDPRTATGSVDLTLSDDINGGTIVADGAELTATIARPGQNERFTFTGSVGDELNLGVNNTTYGCCPAAKVLDPSGGQIVYGAFSSDTDFEVPTLSQAGTYTVIIDPGVLTGTTNLDLTDPPPFTTSYYMASSSTTSACNQGKDAATNGDAGAVILDWGRPAEVNGVHGTLLTGSNAFVSSSDALAATENFARCYYNNAVGLQRIVLAMGTANFHQCSGGCGSLPANYTDAGTDWANRTNQLANYLSSNGYTGQVTAAAGDDAEPAWDAAYPGYAGYNTTHDFIAGYNANSSWIMLDYGSMESGYWTASQEYYVAGGAAEDFPFAEVYQPGNQSNWENLSLWAVDPQRNLPALYFLGVLSDYPYCPSSPCDYAPRAAYVKMIRALQSHASTYQSAISYLSKI